MAFLAGVLPLPVLIDGVRDLDKPRPILDQLQNIRRCEELDPIRCGVAKRLEQPRRDENRNIVRLATEHPGRLFRSQPGRRLSKQRQELMLIFSHIQFAQGPSDASGSVPGNSPCVKTSGLGGGLNTLNTRGTSGSCSRCSPSQAPKPIRTPPRFRLRRASSCLANRNACIRDAWTSALGRCRSGHGQAEPSDVLTKSHPSARASFMLP